MSVTTDSSSVTETQDPYGVAGDGPEAAEGHVYTVTGQDWDSIVAEQAERGDERIVVNMGPQHPSTHGVLRLILEIDGETVTEVRCGVGYLHTGIEKNLEYRTWTQGVTFVTRMDYLSPFFNETAYCLGVERLLGVSLYDLRVSVHWAAIQVVAHLLREVNGRLVLAGPGGDRVKFLQD